VNCRNNFYLALIFILTGTIFSSRFAFAAGAFASRTPAPQITQAQKDLKESQDLWEEAQADYQDSQVTLKARSEVAKVAYTFTQSLCYMYEFRKTNGMDPFDPLVWYKPWEEPFAEAYWWTSDDRLRGSFASWLYILGRGLQSTYSDGDFYFIYARPHFTTYLMQSPGYSKAAAECSERLGRNAAEYLKRDIEFNTTTMSFLSGAVGAGLAFKGIKAFSKTRFMTESVTQLGRIGIRTRWIKWGAIATYAGLVGNTVYADMKTAEDNHAFQEEVQENPELLLEVGADDDPWALRKIELNDFVNNSVHYADLLKKEKLSPEQASQLKSLANQIQNGLEYIQRKKAEFSIKQKELINELENIDDISEKIAEIKSLISQSAALTKDQTALYDKARLLGSLTYALSALDNRQSANQKN
jgi:hypothetical protein